MPTITHKVCSWDQFRSKRTMYPQSDAAITPFYIPRLRRLILSLSPEVVHEGDYVALISMHNVVKVIVHG